ncbi:MAG: hypothetical protein Q7J09_11055 [Methanocalculus sp.]|uniref:hypothetical protein n=1 Tax=Methanocalculus sp. TaxID=2004547 RepID=UPI00272489C0|nr:hypothetical protein [Methanocalculus sp.]MDO9540520.1 hypothetical protein [Methanocalculus sp.]
MIEVVKGSPSEHTGLWMSNIIPYSQFRPQEPLKPQAQIWIRKLTKDAPDMLEKMRVSQVWSCFESTIGFYTEVANILSSNNGNAPVTKEEQQSAIETIPRQMQNRSSNVTGHVECLKSKEFDFTQIPIEMQSRNRWVMWRMENHYKENKITPAKVPYQTNGQKAKSNDPATWSSFDEVTKAYTTGKFSGIGFCLGPDEEIGKTWLGFDVDKRRNPDNGTWDDDNDLALLLELGSYAEVSQSGTGGHAIAWGKLTGDRRRKGSYEIYDALNKNGDFAGRFFVMTGWKIEGSTPNIHDAVPDGIAAIESILSEGKPPIPSKSKPVTPITSKIDDTDRYVDSPSNAEIIAMIRCSKQAEKFSLLYDKGAWDQVTASNGSEYPSPSEARYALISMLYWWTRDILSTHAIMSGSAFAKSDPEKWDRVGRGEVAKVASEFSENDDPPWMTQKSKSDTDAVEEKGIFGENYPPEVIAEARRILEEEDPVAYLLDVFHSEHVGDTTVAQSFHISAASRFVANSKGIHVLVIAPSGKGKSSAYDTTLKQIPKKHQINGSITDKALFYHNIPRGCILVFDDKEMSETLQEVFRSATSDIRVPLSHHTVDTSRKPLTVTLPELCIWWMASAEDTGDDQFKNRCLQPYCDSSEAADQAFFADLKRRTASGVQPVEDQRFAICRRMWEMIGEEILSVHVWFAEAINFHDQNNRRNAVLFIDVIRCFAKMRSRQRAVYNGQILASMDDFDSALKFFSELSKEHGSQVNQITPQEKQLLGFIEHMPESQFTVKSLVECSKSTDTAVRRALNGRKDRGTHGLLGKCPAITKTDKSVTKYDEERKSSTSNSDTVYGFDKSVYNQWKGRGQITLNTDVLKSVIARFTHDDPTVCPHLGKHCMGDYSHFFDNQSDIITNSICKNERVTQKQKTHSEFTVTTPDSLSSLTCGDGACACNCGSQDLGKPPEPQDISPGILFENNIEASNEGFEVYPSVGSSWANMGQWANGKMSIKQDTVSCNAILPESIQWKTLQPIKNVGRCTVCNKNTASKISPDGNDKICEKCLSSYVAAELRRSHA